MTTFTSIILGDESLTQYCAETLISQGHNLAVLVTDNPVLVAWAKRRCVQHCQFEHLAQVDSVAGAKRRCELSRRTLAQARRFERTCLGDDRGRDGTCHYLAPH